MSSSSLSQRLGRTSLGGAEVRDRSRRASRGLARLLGNHAELRHGIAPLLAPGAMGPPTALDARVGWLHAKLVVVGAIRGRVGARRRARRIGVDTDLGERVAVITLRSVAVVRGVEATDVGFLGIEALPRGGLSVAALSGAAPFVSIAHRFTGRRCARDVSVVNTHLDERVAIVPNHRAVRGARAGCVCFRCDAEGVIHPPFRIAEGGGVRARRVASCARDDADLREWAAHGVACARCCVRIAANICGCKARLRIRAAVLPLVVADRGSQRHRNV